MLNLQLIHGLKMYTYLFEKQQEQKAWELYISKYQHMDEKTFIPFSKFYESMKPKKISKKSAEEILSDVKKIRKALGR